MQTIEFLGMPRAGKTTQLQRLYTHLEGQGKRVAIIHDRDRAAHIRSCPVQSLAYILVFFSSILDEVSRYRQEPYDYLLIDNGFNDAIVWARVRFELQEITEEERAAFVTCFAGFKTLVDTTLYFDIPVDVALKRHAASGEHQRSDETAMNESWMKLIRQSYERESNLFQNVIRINGLQTIDQLHVELRTLLHL